MTEREFAYWLNGFAELSGDEPPTDTPAVSRIDDEQLRYNALDMALRCPEYGPPETIVKRAEAYLTFLRGDATSG